MKRFFNRYYIGMTLLFALVLLRMSGVHKHVTVDFFRQHSAAIQFYIQHHYVASVAFFIIVYTAVMACALPLSPLFNLAGGYFFSTIPGTIYATISSVAGATILFLLVRYCFRDTIESWYGDRLATFNDEFNKRGFWYLLSLVLLPITPFSFISIVAGLSTISSLLFVSAVTLGAMPGAALYTFAGRKLMEISSPRDIFSPSVIFALLAMGLISLAPFVMRMIDAVRRRFTK